MEKRILNESLDRLIPITMEFRDCVQNMGNRDADTLADSIGNKIKTLIANYIRRNYAFLTAITGPQGTGKSNLANVLLNVPDEAKLVSEIGRCETVPVILTFLQEDDDPDYPVTKVELISSGNIKNNVNQGVTANTERGDVVMFWQQKEMSYEEARKAVQEDDGIVYIWRVPYNKEQMNFIIKQNDTQKKVPIDDNFALLVLPGIGMDDSWSEFARYTLLTADAAIFVIDHPRYAQEEGENLKEYIKEIGIKTAIVAVSFANSVKDKDRFKNNVINDWMPINPNVCFIDLPDKGKEEIGTAVVELLKKGNNNNFNYNRFKNFLIDMRDEANEAERIITENQDRTFDSILENLVEKVMEKFRAARQSLEDNLLRRIEHIINEHANSCRNSPKIDEIVKSFGGEDGWKRFWTGIIGPEVKNIRRAEKLFSDLWSGVENTPDNWSYVKKIADSIGAITQGDKNLLEKANSLVKLFTEDTNSLSSKISTAIAEWSDEFLKPFSVEADEFNNPLDCLQTLFEANIAVSFTKNSDQHLGDLRRVFQDATALREEIRNYAAGDMEYLESFNNSVGTYLNRTLMRSVTKAKKGLAGSPFVKGGVTSLAATAAFLPGGIIIAEAVMIAVAGLGAFYISHLANLRRRDIQIYDMIRENIDFVKGSTIDSVKENLRYYLNQLENDYKKDLEESLGMYQPLKKAIKLAIATNHYRNNVNDTINKFNNL